MSSDLKMLAKRLTNIRANIVTNMPFFGRLLLNLQFGFANCETAYTDQKRIVFDPNFADSLSDDELEFIMFHELYHCVLNHCSRGRGKINYIYNIACDIVVNSIILEMLCLKDKEIAGNKVMHLAPNGVEGRELNADTVYQMFLGLSDEYIKNKYGNVFIDTHIIWKQLCSDMSGKWQARVKEATSSCGKDGVPLCMSRYIEDVNHNPKCNWKQLLHDYIQFDRSDYSYNVLDRRFLGNDIIMPSFQNNVDGAKVEKLWTLIDSSGSISDKTLSEAMNEICGAVNQVGVSGWLSYFDTAVSNPEPFESIDELMNVSAKGGGGTNFYAIFDALEEMFYEEFPSLILILTDGYSDFPNEEVAKGIPVIWVIIDSDINPPWGKCVHITSE